MSSSGTYSLALLTSTSRRSYLLLNSSANRLTFLSYPRTSGLHKDDLGKLSLTEVERSALATGFAEHPVAQPQALPIHTGADGHGTGDSYSISGVLNGNAGSACREAAAASIPNPDTGGHAVVGGAALTQARRARASCGSPCRRPPASFHRLPSSHVVHGAARTGYVSHLTNRPRCQAFTLYWHTSSNVCMCTDTGRRQDAFTRTESTQAVLL